MHSGVRPDARGPAQLPELVAAWAGDAPGDPFIEEVGGDAVSIGEFDAMAQTWARRLAGLGVRAGETVVTALEPSATAYAIWIGLARLGAIEVPVNAEFVGDFMLHVLDNSGARRVITTKDALRNVAPQLERTPETWTVVLVDDCDGLDGLDTDPAPLRAPTAPHDISCILHTSGTTGPAKGVIVPWAQQLSVAEGVLEALGDLDGDPVYYTPFPVNHIGGRFPFAAMVLRRGRLVVRARFRTQDFWEDIRRHRCTTTLLLGAMAVFLENQAPTEADRDNPLVRILQMPVLADVAEFEERFDVEVATVYNMTELGCPIGSDRRDGLHPGSCGRLREGFEARIVDESDREVPPGEVGELALRHREPWTQMSGYWRDPAATAETTRNLWIHTGDAFRMDESGNFYLVDRMRDTIRRRGENISSAEVERVLGRHPRVLVCAVAGVPSPYGEQDVAAFVVAEPGLTAEDVWDHCEAAMPRFMVPRFVTFVDAMPTTPTGKIRKVDLELTAATADRDLSRTQATT